MTDTPETLDVPAPATPPGQPAGKPRGKQLLILILGGFALAFGGCFLFAVNVEGDSAILFGAAFVIGLLMFLTGIAIAVIRGLMKLFRGSGR